MFFRLLLSLIFSLCLCGVLSTAAAQITISPFGLGVQVDRPTEREIVLTNPTDQDVPFQTWARQHYSRNNAPERDFPGEWLDTFIPPDAEPRHSKGGLVWDPENRWMWSINEESGVCWAFDPANDFQPVAQFQGHSGSAGMTFLNGFLFMISDTNGFIHRFSRDGQSFDNLQLNYEPQSITASAELGMLFVMEESSIIHLYTMEEGSIDEEVGRIENFRAFVPIQSCASMLWVDAHPDGNLWFHTAVGPNGEAGNWAWQVAVNNDEWVVTDLIQTFPTRIGRDAASLDFLGHDGENLWAVFRVLAEMIVIDDGYAELSLVTLDPREGEIGAESALDLTLSLDPADLAPGVYPWDLQFRFHEDAESPPSQITILVSVDSPVGGIAGTVTQDWNNQPLEGATVMLDQYYLERVCNDQGGYSLEEVPIGNHERTFSAPQFLPQTIRVEVEADNEARVDAALLHGEFNMSINAVETSLPPDSQETIDFFISNEGDGPLTFTTRRNMVAEPDIEPWTLRRSYNVGQVFDDSRIQGVVFGDGAFYVSGSGNSEEIPRIYVFDAEGHSRWFDQPRVEGDDRGMRDLAWDGELIWGAVSLRGSQVFGMTPEGEVVYQWDGPYQPTTAITWDPEHEVIWAATTTNNPIAFTREGEREVFHEIERGDLRMYGLAYYSDDPDGFGLYILSKERETNRQTVHKANIETGEMRFVTYLMPDAGGSPEGAYITSLFDPFSVVMMTIANVHPDEGGDRIDVWQLDTNIEWMQVNPLEGRIMSGAARDFTLTLNSHGFEDVLLEGEVVFSHDGFGEESTLSVTLTVEPNSVPVETAPRSCELLSAWPNPFNSSTRIEYSLTKAGRVNLRLFDLSGRLAVDLADRMDSAGRHSVTLDGSVLASGLYFVRLESNNQTATTKLMLVR